MKVMNARTLLLLALSSAVLLLVRFALAQPTAVPAETTVLYDGALGDTPDTQGFLYQTDPFLGAAATQAFADGATVLDTTAVPGESAGYFALGMPVLDRAQGFTATFVVQIEGEAHANPHRAGFSVILLGKDRRGIELGFWQDEIWAQEGGEAQLFTHAEGAAFDTTAARVTYALSINGARYTLAADGAAVLEGPVRDYTAFSGAVDPYETPNLFFLGDDTSSAAARVQLAYAAITVATAVTPTPSATPPPTPAATPTATATAPPPVFRFYVPHVQ